MGKFFVRSSNDCNTVLALMIAAPLTFKEYRMKVVTKKKQKEYIKDKLKTSKKWALRALELLYSYQTPTEKMVQDTSEINGVGFNSFDVEILSDLAIRARMVELSDNQMKIVHDKMPKYWNQVLQACDTKKLNVKIISQLAKTQVIT